MFSVIKIALRYKRQAIFYYFSPFLIAYLLMEENTILFTTLPIEKITALKNARAWVSMVFT